MDGNVREFCGGKDVTCEKFVNNNGVIVFDINTDGLNQRVTYTELAAAKA